MQLLVLVMRFLYRFIKISTPVLCWDLIGDDNIFKQVVRLVRYKLLINFNGIIIFPIYNVLLLLHFNYWLNNKPTVSTKKPARIIYFLASDHFSLFPTLDC